MGKLRYIKLYEEIDFVQDWEESAVSSSLSELSYTMNQLKKQDGVKYILLIFDKEDFDEISTFLSEYGINISKNNIHDDGRYYMTVEYWGEPGLRNTKDWDYGYWNTSNEHDILNTYHYEKIIRF